MEKLFSITKEEFEVSFFRASGPGGQNVNKRDTACRITHKASGCVAESREERQQGQNKKIAFNRLVTSKKFQNWLRVEAAARMQGFRDLEAKVDAMLAPEFLKIETL